MSEVDTNELLSILVDEWMPKLLDGVPGGKVLSKLAAAVVKGQMKHAKDSSEGIKESIQALDKKLDKLAAKAEEREDLRDLRQTLDGALKKLDSDVTKWTKDLKDPDTKWKEMGDIFKKLGTHETDSLPMRLNSVHEALAVDKFPQSKIRVGGEKETTPLGRLRDLFSHHCTREDQSFNYDVVHLKSDLQLWHDHICDLENRALTLLVYSQTYKYMQIAKGEDEDEEENDQEALKSCQTRIKHFQKEQDERKDTLREIFFKTGIYTWPSTQFLLGAAKKNIVTSCPSLHVLKLHEKNAHFATWGGSLMIVTTDLKEMPQLGFTLYWGFGRELSGYWRLYSSKFAWHGMRNPESRILCRNPKASQFWFVKGNPWFWEFSLYSDEGYLPVECKLIPEASEKDSQAVKLTIAMLNRKQEVIEEVDTEDWKDNILKQMFTTSAKTPMKFPVSFDDKRNALSQMAFPETPKPMYPSLGDRAVTDRRVHFWINNLSTHNFVMVLERLEVSDGADVYMHSSVWLAGQRLPILTAEGVRNTEKMDSFIRLKFKLYRLKPEVDASRREAVEPWLQQEHTTGQLSFHPDKVDTIYRDLWIKIANPTGFTRNWVSAVVSTKELYKVPDMGWFFDDAVALDKEFDASENYVYQNNKKENTRFPGLKLKYDIGGSNTPDGSIDVETTDDWVNHRY